MGDRVAASVKTSAEQLLEVIAGELRALQVQNRLFENEQRELGLLAAFVDSTRSGLREETQIQERLRKLADAIGNVAFLGREGMFADLLNSHKRRILQFITHAPDESDVRTLMIVADAAPIRGLLRTILERHGFIVHAVADELDAMLMLERERYCLIIVDLTTRRVSGKDIVRRLSGRNVNVPILVTTSANESAYDFDSPMVRAVLKKPFDVERVAQLANEICEDTKLPETSPVI